MIKIKSKRAFTLLEMSIVILIIGILVVGTINFQITIDTKSKENITADKINRIEKAISEYFLKNGKLPCPSNIKAEKTDSTYGKESRYDGTCSGYEEKFVNNGLIYGGVPTKDLELTDDYSVDAWGSSISYVISKKYGDKKIYLSDNEETIKLQNTKGENITSNAIYILISSGKNKNGAFRNGTQWNTNNSLNDSVNSFSNNFSNVFKKDLRTDNFDDIVVFKEKDLFVIKEDLETLPCTLKDLRELDSNWNYNSFNKCNSNGVCPQGTIIPSQNDCPGNNVSKNPSNVETKTKPLRKCLNYGQWSNIIYPCIDSCGESNIDNITTNMILSSGILGYSINRNFLKRGKIGEIIELQCLGDKVGYIKLECGDDGNWSYKSGDCYDKEKVAVFCQNSQLNSNDKNMVFSTTTGTTESPRGIEGECASGYTKSEDKDVIAICQRDGTWFYTDACSLNSGSITFNYTGSMQTWTVPDGVTSIKIQVWGAQGGSEAGSIGGKGGYSYGTLSVSSGNTVYIYVGGQGVVNTTGTSIVYGGYNGGGNSGINGTCNSTNRRGSSGGGATDIRYGGTALSNRKIVAGGGGGGQDCCSAPNGGAGGGGSYSGDDGSTSCKGVKANGGTLSSGGNGGSYSDSSYSSIASSGSLGQGGAAGNGCCQCAGGGGGGGYYGGGGGNCSGTGAGGSGYIGGVEDGGGSSGIRSGNGMARICWGSNTDCDTYQVPQCQNSQLSFTNATFENTAGTTNINQTQTGTCNTGYFGSITATCNEDGWSYTGSCYESGSFTFNYTGSQQTWTVPNGVTSIKIVAFGAKGGGDNCGYGGRSRGTLNVSSGQTFYITVGGSGSCSSSGGSSTAGYNGGGYDGTEGCGTNGGHGCGGGGATHIARTSGLLKNLSSSSVLLVAGGGGGKSESTSCGGAGGGGNSSGNDGVGEWKGFGGTVSGGGSGSNGNGSGSFGLGGNVTRSSTSSGKWCGGAGGGGYYGGGAGEWASESSAGGGGGGSGFCGNGMQDCGGTNGYNNGYGWARICWGDNTDCDW